jgi:DNA-binding SARP family transcriptional activator/tetratricopeptide (TPR) repeat protein
MIRLWTLGECVIEIDDVRIQPKSQQLFGALLFLVLQAGKRVTRQRIANVLWPHLDERRSLGTLRQVAYALRRLGVHLHWDTHAVQIAARDVDLDVNRVMARYAAGSIDPDGPIGAFLTGYTPRLSPEFNAWVDGERARQHTALTAVLLGVLNENRVRGRWSAVDLLARRCLAFDMLNEEATFALAEAAAMSGRKIEALNIIDRYLMDLDGRPTLVRVPAELLRVRIADHLPQAQTAADAVFIGRDEELALFNSMVRKARGGHGGAGLVWGTPGIGKARMAHEVGRLATLAGVHVITTIRQASDVRRPLSLFADLTPILQDLPGALGSSPVTLRYLARLTGDDPGPVAGVPDPGDEGVPGYVLAAVRRALADLITAVSEEQPLLLIIEHAHHLDPISLEILSDLIADIATHHIALLLTAPSPFPVASPLHTGARNLVVREIHPLTPDQSERLLHDLIHNVRGGLDPATVSRFTTLADGNPYFLHELAVSWMYYGDRATVPGSLTSALDHRVSLLSEPALRVLQSATLLAANSTFPRLERTTHYSHVDLLRAIDELHRAGLLRTTPGTVLPRHDVVAQSALGRLTPISKYYVHHCIAVVLEHELSAPHHQLALLWDCAAHFQAAQEFEHALTLVSKCAQKQLSLNLPREALELWQRAESLCRTADEHQAVSEGVIPALFALGDREQIHCVANDAVRLREGLAIRETRAQDWQLDALEASMFVYPGSTIALYAQAFELLDNRRNSVPHRVRAGTCALKIASALFDRERLTEAYTLLTSLFERYDAPAESIAAVELIYHTDTGDLFAGLQAGRDLVRISRNKEPLAILAKRLRWLARPLEFLGEFEEARAVLEEARDIAIQIESIGYRQSAEHSIAWTFLDQGNIEGVRHWLEQGSSCAQLPDSDNRKVTWSFLNAVVRILEGDLPGATEYAAPVLRIPVAELAQPNPTRLQHMALTMQCLLETNGQSPEGIQRLEAFIASFQRLQAFGEQDLAAFALADPAILRRRPIDAGMAITNYVLNTRLERYPLPPYLSERVGPITR